MIAFGIPWALAGLVAAALPVLLHLVQRREPPEVAFPAVRYLEDATRDHRRRLKLRNLLLLIVRTMLIIMLVLAAARPSVARSGVGDHEPTALVLVVDNSASSAAVNDGASMLSRAVDAARSILARATPADMLWLITADGVSRRGSAEQLGTHLDAVAAVPVRLDLGVVVSQGRDLVAGSGLVGEVVLVTDLQRSALTTARGTGPLLVIRPRAPSPANRALTRLEAGAQPWGDEGGRIDFVAMGADSAAIPAAVAIDGRPAREVLVTVGVPSTQRLTGLPTGWNPVTVTLAPDEFRLDDTAHTVVRVAPAVPLRWDPGDRWIAAAFDVLAAEGRVRVGDGLRVGSLAPGPSVVLPPTDAALVGTVNRALAARGSSWRFGTLVVSPSRSDSSELLPAREPIARRHVLERVGTGGEILVTADGAPWVVRSGDVVLAGSRFDPEWTALPLGAGFVPFLDALVMRTARGAAPVVRAIAGEPFQLPERTTSVVHDGTPREVEGGAPWRPQSLGIHYLVSGADTIGAAVAHLDPRESELERATDREVGALWRGARVENLDRGPRIAFTAAGRGDLRAILLTLAVLLVLAEAALAGRVTKRS